MRCVISQPTFLPWLGWFDLLDQSDQFVLLDDVQFSRQSWQQRNRIRGREGLEIISVPVRIADRSGQNIGEVEIADSRFAGKFLRTVQGNYARAAYFEAYFPAFAKVVEAAAAEGKLCTLNCAIIRWLATALGISTPMVMASSLNVGGLRGEHVALLCESLGAKDYLSPAGAGEYLREDFDAFASRGLRVWLHEYEHPVYRQRFDPFLPYASVLDLLLNEGPSALEILRSGRRPSRQMLASEVSQEFMS
jgi:hypothetical protein